MVVHRRALPRQLFSDTKEDILSGRVYELSNGFFVDGSFWTYMTEQRAYYAMNRLHDALRRNNFSGMKFDGNDFLRLSVPRREMYAELENPFQITAADKQRLNESFPNAGKELVEGVLRRRGIVQAKIDRLNLPKRLSPVTAYILAFAAH